MVLSVLLEEGELTNHRPAAAGAITDADVIGLGALLQDPPRHGASDHRITIADLTGVAMQDIAIAKSVLRYLEQG